MDVVYERVAALDVSKMDAKVCVRVPGKRRGTFTKEGLCWLFYCSILAHSSAARAAVPGRFDCGLFVERDDVLSAFTCLKIAP